MLRKFFIKRFGKFVVIMLLPTLVLFSLLSVFITVINARAIQQQGYRTLEAVNGNIINTLNNTLYQQELTVRNNDYSLALQKLLSASEMELKDAVFLRNVKTFLKSIEASYDHIHSIYIYLDGFTHFLSSETAQRESVSAHYDKEWLETYRKYLKDSPDEKQYIETRTLQKYQFAPPRKIITYYKHMTYLDGVVVVNVNAERVDDAIQSLLYAMDQIVLYTNDMGQILYCSDPKMETVLTSQHVDFNKASKELPSWTRIENSFYYVQMLDVPKSPSQLMSLIPLSTFLGSMKAFIALTVVIILLNLLIVTLLAWTVTKRTFDQIHLLIDVSSAAEKGEEIQKPTSQARDEYSLIMNNILYLFFTQSQMKSKLIEKQHQQEIAELMALQLQINPHFIFNTLQTMDFQVMKSLGRESSVHFMLQQLSGILKYALDNPMETVSLTEEINYLKMYLQIQSVRFHNSIVAYFEVDEGLENIQVFRLMLQPMVENSLSHGLFFRDDRFYLKIKITGHDQMVKVLVIDTGCGMSPQRVAALRESINDKHAKNIGLTNLNRRLILHYGEDSALHIRSKEGYGTSVGFCFPRINCVPDEEK